MSRTKNERINFLKRQVPFTTDIDNTGLQNRMPKKTNHSYRLKVSVGDMVPFVVDWQLPTRGTRTLANPDHS